MESSSETKCLVPYLVDHARASLGPQPWDEMQGWGHIGAVLSDAGLQAAVKYESVVRPRIETLIEQHPDAATTSGFTAAMATDGLGTMLSWNGSRKLRTITELAQLLSEQDVETVDDLRYWLMQPANVARLQLVYGVGNKTADYLCLLVGISNVAVDRQLRAFLADAIEHGYVRDGADEVDRVDPASLTYQQVAEAYRQAAIQLRTSVGALDHRVWQYESGSLLPLDGPST
jgi:hypothetical protein